MTKTLRWSIAILIFITGVAWLEHYLGWKSLLASWKHFSFTTFLGLSLFTLLSYLLRAYRVQQYFIEHTQDAFGQSLRLSLLHNAINNFLPMRLGEASFPILMKRQFALPLEHSSAGLLWIRLADLHCLSWLFLLSLTPSLGLIMLVLAGIWLLLPSLLLNLWQRSQVYLPTHGQKIAHTLEKYSPGSLAQWRKLYFLTLWIWLSKLGALTIVMLNFIELSPSLALFAVISADFSSVLPIHGLAGSGTYEAAMVLALAPFHIENTLIITAAVNVHLYLLATSVMSVGCALLIKERRQGSENRQKAGFFSG